MRKLVVNDNNVVVNIIIDEDNVITGLLDRRLIVHEDLDVTIGDTVNNDGSLRSRRQDFYQASEDERLAAIKEDVEAGRLLINEAGELTLPNGMVLGMAPACCNNGSI